MPRSDRILISREWFGWPYLGADPPKARIEARRPAQQVSQIVCSAAVIVAGRKY